MRSSIPFLVGLAIALPSGRVLSEPVETRCGWLSNPTPGNWYLDDRDGSWEIGAQGGYQAEGIDHIPDLSGNEFVETNGPHGYACACLTLKLDRKAKRVALVTRVKQRPLKDCLGDRALPAPPK